MTAYRTLINYVDSFIRDNKTVNSDCDYELDISDFDDDDLVEFAAHLINYFSSKREGWDWIFEDAYREEMIGAFTQSILHHRAATREESKESFFNDMQKSIVKTQRRIMQQWIDDRIGIVQSDDDYEAQNPTEPDWDYAA